MQVVPDDVLAGVKTKWESDATLVAAVPGGLHHGRPTTSTENPYAVMNIEEGDREEFSGTTYLQKFKVTISVWSNVATPNVATIRRDMDKVFDRKALTITNADNVTYVKPLPGKLQLEKDQKDANDVLMTSGAWEIMIQATRV